MEVQYENQPFVGANDALPAAPPFVLEATRRSAVDHIKRYQEVFSTVSQTESRDSSAAVVDLRGYGATADANTRQTIVKGKLTHDLNELLESVSALGVTLVAKRTSVWISQGVFAAGLHFVLQSGVAPQPLRQQFWWLRFAYYPIALYELLKSEYSILHTNRAREAFERILESVHGKRRLREADVDYVAGTEWDAVPWKEFAGSIYFSN